MRFTRKGIIRSGRAAFGVAIAFACCDLLFSHQVAEVRIDSGDRRMRGWVLRWPESRVPGRERLVTASKELGIPAEWHKPPFTTPSYPDQGRHWRYSRTAWWVEHEPALGKVLLRQLADYYQNPPAEPGYPPAAYFLVLLEWDQASARYDLGESWTAIDEEQMRYLLEHAGYTPTPGGLVATRLEELAITPPSRR